MIGIHFKRDLALRFMKSLDKGLPIEPPDGQWTRDNALMLAGACRFLALSQGPVRSVRGEGGLRLQSVKEIQRLPLETREALTQTLDADLSAAIVWYSHATEAALDGKYDADFEPEHRAILDGGTSELSSPTGFKHPEKFGGRPLAS